MPKNLYRRVMIEKHVDYFSAWPFDDALSWMTDAQTRVKKESRLIIVGCGSHDESVITTGKNSKFADDHDHLRVKGGLIFRNLDRGGGLTAHEPGQIVLYPVLDLNRWGLSVKVFVELLEETLISFLAELNVRGERSELGPGVFVHNQKIGFIGLRIEEHITKHGLAINVLNDAAIFSTFSPCGIENLSVTTVKKYVTPLASLEHYMKMLVNHFFWQLHLVFTDKNRNEL